MLQLINYFKDFDGDIDFLHQKMKKNMFQNLVQKLNKSTYRLTALNNFVYVQSFWCKNSTSTLIKFLHSVTTEVQLAHFASYANYLIYISDYVLIF